jgi:hypothetical protein
MTFATGTTDARELLAERFGEDLDPLLAEGTTDHAGRRARFIATMHALIAFVLAHPDLPAPWSFGLSIHVAGLDEMRAAATALGVKVTGEDRDEPIVYLPEPLGDASEFYTPIGVHLRPQNRPL